MTIRKRPAAVDYSHCLAVKRPAARGKTFHPRIRGPRWGKPASSYSRARHAQWDHAAEDAVRSRRSKTPLSGRALVYVAPILIGASFCVNDDLGYGTLAICGAPVRRAARRGDLVIVVTGADCARKRGGGDVNVISGVLLIDNTMSVVTYHGPRAPPWAKQMRDRIYNASVDKPARSGLNRLAKAMKSLGTESIPTCSACARDTQADLSVFTRMRVRSFSFLSFSRGAYVFEGGLRCALQKKRRRLRRLGLWRGTIS